MIVVDASVAIAWSFADQRTPALIGLSARISGEGGIAPQLWPVEVANVVLRARRRGQLPPGADRTILTTLAATNIAIDDLTAEQAWHGALDLAIKHGLTVYDATYLELAVRTGLPLATLDDALAKAARAEGLTVLP